MNNNISSFEIITEASALDNTGVINEAMMSEDILTEYSEIESLSDSLIYKEEMVPVIMIETSIGTKYLMEHENVIKVMQGYPIDEMKQEFIAMKKIAESNGIDFKDTVLVVESDESLKRNITTLNHQIRNTKNPAEKQHIRNKIKLIQDKIKKLKDSGISIVKKPNK